MTLNKKDPTASILEKAGISIIVFSAIIFCILLSLAVPIGTQAEGLELPLNARAGGLELPEEDWNYEIYNNRTGMPFSEANAIAQTPDGFIYFGCYGGLVRYSGKEFYRFTDDATLSIMSLFTDSKGRLWIGSNSEGISRLEAGHVVSFREDAEKYVYVRCITEDAAGNILYGTKDGLCYVDQNDTPHFIDDPRLNSKEIVTLKADPRGVIYGVDYKGDVFSVENLAVTGYIESPKFGDSIVKCLLPDPEHENMLYLGLEIDESVYYGDFSKGLSGGRYIPAPGMKRIDCLRLHNGMLWVGADSGFCCLDEADGYVDLSRAPLKSNVVDIISDYEGNIWVASSRQGVLKVTESIFEDFSSVAGLPDMVVNTTWVKDGKTYIGSDSGLIVLGRDYERLDDPISRLLSDVRVRCIKEDSKGNLWFCCYNSDSGLTCLSPDGNIKVFNTENGLATKDVRTILELKDGTMAVSVIGALQFIRNGKIVETYDQSKGLKDSLILTMCEDEDGSLLLGMNGEGLQVLKNGEIHDFSDAASLGSGVIMRIKKDDRRGCDWIITNVGLCCYRDGVVTPVSNFPCRHNYDIFFPDGDNVWVFGGDGLYVADGKEMMEGKVSRYNRYDFQNGLPYTVTAHCRNYQDPEGNVYMSGIGGVVKVNLNRKFNDISSVKLSIPFVELDDREMYLAPGETLTIPSRTKRIRIHAYALSYSLIEPMVAYTLVGFDEGKTLAEREEIASIAYTNLPGGNYEFSCAVIDPETGEEKQSLILPVVKERKFHEQPFFWILIALSLIGAIVFFVRLLVKRKEREMEEDQIRTELSFAADIQASFLPSTFPAFPDRKEFDIYASMEPAKEVGGDFYDFFLMDDDHLAMVMADVSGKGMGAALFMVRAKTLIKNCAESGKDKGPARILADVNDRLCQENEAELFVTVWLGILQISTGAFVSASAGHEYPALSRKGEGFALIKDSHGPGLGMLEGLTSEDYEEMELTLRAGDRLFVYTDGVPEATNAKLEIMGYDRMLSALNGQVNPPLKALLSSVRKAIDAFAGQAPQFDDITMLVLEMGEG